MCAWKYLFIQIHITGLASHANTDITYVVTFFETCLGILYPSNITCTHEPYLYHVLEEQHFTEFHVLAFTAGFKIYGSYLLKN
jgi:hypothetical protein